MLLGTPTLLQWPFCEIGRIQRDTVSHQADTQLAGERDSSLSGSNALASELKSSFFLPRFLQHMALHERSS